MPEKQRLYLHQFIVILIFVISQTCFSQTSQKHTITGLITDTSGLSIPYAPVCLLGSDTCSNEVLAAAISDSTGQFKIGYNSAGMYRLQIKSFSYQLKSLDIQLKPEKKNWNWDAFN